MIMTHKQFIKRLDAYKNAETVTADIKWLETKQDLDYFDICADKLLDLGVGSVLDLACGKAQFLKKTMERGISSFGIEPRIIDGNGIGKEPYVARASFESLIEYAKSDTEHIPIFDCIVINNTMHGMQKKSNIDLLIQDLFNFFIKYTNYIVITEPQWSTWGDNQNHFKKKCQFPEKFELIHEFKGSHGGKTAFHNIYKVLK